MLVSSINSSTSINYFEISTNLRKEAQPNHELTSEEEKKVKELKARDTEVRQHEQAHMSAAGQYAEGGPKFKYVTGPDGKRYAVGGEVKINTSKVQNDPKATIKKAQTIKRAALAPSDPSAKDRQVAAEASSLEVKARQELAEHKKSETQIYNKNGQQVQQPQLPSIVDVII